MTTTSRFSLTEEDRERLEGCRVVASVSGGKDSAALSLWLTEQGIDHDRIFADTGWEHPDTYSYLRGPLTEKLGIIQEVRSEVGGMGAWVKKKGMFPTRLRRWCTEELKVKPIKKHLQTYDCELVNAVGIRAAESSARAKMPRWEEWSAMDCEVWRPLIEWSEQDVIDIHVRHGLAPNPLYLRGSGVERVGCWPCIFSRKREIAQVADLTPWRIDQIREFERLAGDAAEKRYEARGETMAERGHNRPTFFNPSIAGDTRNRMVPIDDVVAWARTSRGGKQLMLLDTEPPGCVRWGMCEGHKDEE